MFNIAFFNLADDMRTNKAAPILIEGVDGFNKSSLREYMLSAPKVERDNIKDWITDQAIQYSNTPANIKRRQAREAELAATVAEHKARIKNATSSAPMRRGISRKNLAIGGGALGLGVLGAGAYALSRRRHNQEE